MKLDNHNSKSSLQIEDVLDETERRLSKDSVKKSKAALLFDANEKSIDSSQTEVEDRDGFWQVSEFDSYNSVVNKTVESNMMEVKDYEALNCHYYENSSRIEEKMHLISDKSKDELEATELVICYKESSYLDLKDICVDENLPSCERILFETDVEKEHLRTLLLLEKDSRSNHFTRESTEITGPTSDCLKCCEGPGSDNRDSQVGLEDTMEEEVNVHEVAEDVCISQTVSKDQESAVEILQQEPSSEDVDVEMPLKEPGMEAISSELPLTPADESGNVSNAEEPENTLTDIGKAISASPPEESSRIAPISGLSNGNDQMDSSDNGNQVNKVQNQNSRALAGFFRDQDSYGETSFSMAGPISGLITYSGTIAYSGSLSLRSDSSTTSTRSFAFPVLQSDWHSSPVRMAKAERRHLRKHRGWMLGLLCCRF